MPGNRARFVLFLVLPLLVASLTAQRSQAQSFDPATVPPELRAWIPWIAANEPGFGCTRVASELVCAFPGTLELVVSGSDVRFSLFVVLDRERVVSLPGGIGEWPIDVVEGGRALVVVDADGAPRTRLGAGSHRIDGRIAFGHTPESIHVPADVARIVAVAGAVRTPLSRASEGVVPLHGVVAAGGGAAESDTVSTEIVRRIADELPLRIDTQITIRVGGRARPIALGRALVAGSVPSAVESTLPIQVGPDGSVLVQAQSGTHRIRIAALVSDPNAALVAPTLPAPWATQEIWLFAPVDENRQVDVGGARSIDPQSPSIPEDWRSSAAFVLHPGERLTLTTVRRGEPGQPPNAITIARRMWLDFDGSGFSIEDTVSGELHRADRLDLVGGELGRVSIGGVGQLITVPPDGPRNARGVEVRSAEVALEAEWRYEGSPSDVPAVGWSEGVRSLAIQLNLPPGYTLFATRGVDSADSWLERWDVGPIFLVLLLAVVASRLFGRAAGLVMGATLVLTFFEDDAPTFLWLFVLVPLAALPLFKKGVFARLVFFGYAILAFALVIDVGLLVTKQLRYALHPQLYTEDLVGSGYPDATVYDASVATPEAAAPPMEQAARDSDSDGIFGGAIGGSPGVVTRGSGGSSSGYANVRTANWIDPNAVVQTGHGLVSWSHSQTQLSWTAEVAKDHRIQLYLVTPTVQRLLALLRAAGSLFLLVCLLRKRPSFPEGNTPAPAKEPPSAPKPEPKADETIPDAALPVAGATGPVVIGLAFALASTFGGVAQAQPVTNVVEPAAATAEPPMLGALRERLLRAPDCGEQCARFGDAVLTVDGDSLRFELTAHAEVRAAIALPGPMSNFVPDVVTVDGAVSHALRATDDGRLLLRLEPGVHDVVLTASLASRGAVALSFSASPGRVDVRATGWSVSGVDENGLVRAGLELRRTIAAPTAGEGGAEVRTSDVPVWLAVERHIDVGVQWLVRTTIRRLSSTTAPGVVRLPALPGESVLGNEATVAGGFVVATIPQGVPELAFTSSVAVTDAIALTSPRESAGATELHYSATWSYSCSPLWHCTDEGVVVLHRLVDGGVAPRFMPYPGETLTIRPVRLAAAPGRSFTIDGASLSLVPGTRSRTSTVVLEVRTSVSNTLRLVLPRGVDVERVEVDGIRRAAQLVDGNLAIAIAPENRRVTITFLESRGLDFEVTTPRIRINSDVVDLDLTVQVPDNRWVLFASGPSWGPIVLYWGHLFFVIVLAIGLGRVPGSPLKKYEWALLVLGLTQIPLVFTGIVVAWFYAVKFQQTRKLEGLWFNLAQLALIGLALFSAGILISAVWIGLTNRPDMQIVGNGSHASSLHWYADRSRGVLPTASFFSVSVWVWKGLMLAWAFWLASSVVRWSIWAFAPFRDGGFFVRTKR